MNWITISFLLTTTYCLVTVKSLGLQDSRRFIFDDFVYDCQHCYDCVCKLTRCPSIINPIEIGGAWAQCASNVHDLNCTAAIYQHGQWSDWSEWSSCTGSCQDTSRTRKRTCTNPPPMNCGKPCDGNDMDIDRTCTRSLCGTLSNLLDAVANKSSTEVSKSSSSVLSSSTSSFSSTSASLPSSSPSSVRPLSTSSSTTTSPTPSTSPTFLSTVGSRTSPTAVVTDTTSIPASCAKFCAINAVANKAHQTSGLSRGCSDGTTGSSDAILLNCCGLSNPSQWKPGPSVMAHCEAIRQYSPVAAFNMGQIQPGSEGVFVSCLNSRETGFKKRKTSLEAMKASTILLVILVTATIFYRDVSARKCPSCPPDKQCRRIFGRFVCAPRYSIAGREPIPETIIGTPS